MKRHSKQGGIALLLVLAFATLFVIVVGAASFFAMRRIATSELQEAANAAVLAGTSILTQKDTVCKVSGKPCTARQTWDLVQATTREVLSQHSALGVGSLSLAAATFVDGDMPTWTLPNGLRVVVQRGRWKPEGLNGLPEFESMEGVWQDRFPGIPRFMASYAVRVTVDATFTPPFFGNIAPSTGTLTVTAAAALDLAKTPVAAAPFAVPVCSLLDSAGADFNPASRCNFDRMVAGINRHCPPGSPDCGNIPEFAWDPMFPATSPALPAIYRQSLTDVNGKLTYWTGLGVDRITNPPGPPELTPYGVAAPFVNNSNANLDKACFWATPHYPKASANYLVAGLADVPPILEQKVLNQIMDPQSNAVLGGDFNILASGLTAKATAEGLWKKMIGRNRTEQVSQAVSDSIYPSIVSTFMLNPWLGSGTGPSINRNAWFSEVRASAPYACPDPSNPAKIKRPATWTSKGGTCNSWRSGWGRWNYFNDPKGNDADYNYVPPYGYDPNVADPYQYALPPVWNSSASKWESQSFTQLPVWKTVVPIIADGSENGASSQISCPGMFADSPATDPPIADRPYQIIGFTQLYVYDLDIGEDPPQYPPNSASFKNNTWDMYKIQDSVLGQSLPNPGTLAVDGSAWAFSYDDGNGVGYHPCNVVRTRLVCDQPPWPSPQIGDFGSSEPTLVAVDSSI